MVKRIGMVIVGATLVVAHCLLGGAAFLPLSRERPALPAGVRYRYHPVSAGRSVRACMKQ